VAQVSAADGRHGTHKTGIPEYEVVMPQTPEQTGAGGGTTIGWCLPDIAA
jgi:hypothetical protein